MTACDRSEFFIVGKPLFEVAKAEKLAAKGELVVDRIVHQYATTVVKGEGENKGFTFESVSASDSDFHRVLYREASVSTNQSVVTVDEEQRNRNLLAEVKIALVDEFDRHWEGRAHSGLFITSIECLKHIIVL